jgi:hypothetical protein
MRKTRGGIQQKVSLILLPVSTHASSIRALSAASAAKFNIAPVRWQHPLHVAIVPTESKGKT